MLNFLSFLMSLLHNIPFRHAIHFLACSTLDLTVRPFLHRSLDRKLMPYDLLPKHPKYQIRRLIKINVNPIEFTLLEAICSVKIARGNL